MIFPDWRENSLRCITISLFAKRCNCTPGKTLIFWKILRQFLLLFLEEFTPWLGTAAALGGTVAVVSPALSRPSPPANESSSAGRGGWSPGERTSAAPPPPTLLSLSGQNGKLLPATPPTTSKSTQKTTPDHNVATTLAIITVLVAIMTATVEKVS